MVYRDVENVAEGSYACRFSEGGNPRDDYQSHLAGQRSIVEKIGPGKPPMALLIYQDPGFPPPDAVTRREVVALTDAPEYSAVTAIVSKSAVIRGVVTAINWLRRKDAEETIHDTAASAVAWLEEKRGAPLPQLRKALVTLEIE
jgi:hypothetical protein